MIQTIVDDCLRDGQFDDCDLTMRDLSIIVATLERTVTTVFHHRIDYPGFDFNRERAKRRRTDPGASSEAAGPRARLTLRVEVQSAVAGAPPPARVRRLLSRAARAARSRAEESLGALLRRRRACAR